MPFHENAWFTVCPHSHRNFVSSSQLNNLEVLGWCEFLITKTFFTNFNNIIYFYEIEWKSVYTYIHNTHSILVIINDVCQKKMRIFFEVDFLHLSPKQCRDSCNALKWMFTQQIIHSFKRVFKSNEWKTLWTKLEENPVSNRENANVWFAFLNIQWYFLLHCFIFLQPN